MQDDDAAPGFFSQWSQAQTQVQFFPGKKFVIESADFLERRRFDKDERPGEQAAEAAQSVPAARQPLRRAMIPRQPDDATAGQTSAGADGGGDFGKQFRARLRIGVNEQQPFAGGDGRAAIARPADLIDGFKDNRRAVGAGDGRRVICGVVIAHDEFRRETGGGERGATAVDRRQRLTEQARFIESRNDDGYLQRVSLAETAGRVQSE